MNAIEQNSHFQNEFALHLMAPAVAQFWNKYLDEIDDHDTADNYRIARAQYIAFKKAALDLTEIQSH